MPTMLQRRRFLRPALLLPLLGAATTLIIPIAITRFADAIPGYADPQVQLATPLDFPTDEWRWFVNRHTGIGHTCLVFRRGQPGLMLEAKRPVTQVVRPADVLAHWSAMPERGMYSTAHAWGWPARCLRANILNASDSTDVLRLRTPLGQLMIPTRPIWTGLALDTLFWTAAWALAIHAFAQAARHWRTRRTRRGLCARCAYDRRGLPPESPCPECGAPPAHASQ